MIVSGFASLVLSFCLNTATLIDELGAVVGVVIVAGRSISRTVAVGSTNLSGMIARSSVRYSLLVIVLLYS